MGAMRLCFLLFCLFLASVSSVRKLNNTNDLKNTAYGKPSPRHGLKLLYWFAQHVDQNNNINFNPSTGDYGFHYFGNREAILPSLSRDHSYYEVGNLNQGTGLPEYLHSERSQNRNNPRSNMDRLIVYVERNRPQRILRVFITSHNLNSNDFNPSDTYEIDLALISQIRQDYPDYYAFSRTTQHDNTNDGCSRFLKYLGYIIINFGKRNKRSPDSLCNTHEGIKLEIKTTTQCYSKLIWENIPADIMKKDVYIEICQKTPSSDPNKDPTQDSKYSFRIDKSSGAKDTSVSLNAGLQPRLLLYTSKFYLFGTKTYIWNGPEFDGANKVIPIRIKGIDASLQLYAGDGYACARLYIKKTFSNWKNVLKDSWVGFYQSSQDKNDGYYTYQYAKDFAMIDNTTIKNYDIYQYKSSLAISPGVQIRFFLDKKYNKVLARTTPWESDEKVTSTWDKGNPKLSSAWSYPEFFNEPEFYDANNVLPVKIQMYDAGLQLFTQDGKACARLYIKKTFTDWKKTFYNSWVGFYTSSEKTNKQYNTYQYAVKFEKMQDGTKIFYVYQYKSKLDIAPGVHIRFMKDKGYDKTLVKTEAWKSG